MTHFPRRTVRWGAIAAVTTATALIATGCAGGETAPASDGGKTEITVVHAAINYEPLYLAEQEGFFDEVGLDVKIVPGGTAQDNLGQLAGGSADISIISWDTAVTATAEGLPIKVISNNGIISTEFDTSGVVVREDSGITSMADLEGKTIAFNSIGSGGNVPVLQALKDAGVDPDDVTQVALPFASMQSALEQSQVDAIFPSDSFYAQALEVDDFTVISNPSREYRGGLGITLWSATDQWLAANAGTAEKFNEAMGKAVEFYMDPANVEAVYQVRADVTGQPVDTQKFNLVEASLVTDPEVSQATTDALEEFGFVQNPKPVDEILWEGAPRS
ncbi:ABC transporter substrate-binding protein [Microbacterium sp. GXF7504]